MLLENIQITRIDEQKLVAVGIHEDEEILIDPFCSQIWRWENRHHYCHIWTFQGCFHQGVFIPHRCWDESFRKHKIESFLTAELKLEFDIHDYLMNLEEYEKRWLSEILVWDDEIFGDIIDSLLSSKVVTPSYNFNIYKAREKFVDQFPKLIQNHIRTLLHEIDAANKEYKRVDQWAYKISHWAYDNNVTNCPRKPEFQNGSWPTDDKIKRILEILDEDESKSK